MAIFYLKFQPRKICPRKVRIARATITSLIVYVHVYFCDRNNIPINFKYFYLELNFFNLNILIE